MKNFTPAILESLLDERPEEGIFRVHRSMFLDPEIFELEMRYIFEGNWVYVAHESQIPNPNDFMTTHIGRQPIILTRTAQGDLSAVLNACAHRGSMLERSSCGNKKLFVCPFHAWSFRNDGKVLSCGESETSGYGPGFQKDNHDLAKVPRLESYRGFIFASLNADVPELQTHLGAACKFLDMIVDQDPKGEIEVLPGIHTYTYDGNWKLQAENGVDGYHVGPIHGNYVETTTNRQRIAAGRKVQDVVDVGGFNRFDGGFYAFENGHVVLWNESPNPEVRPAFESKRQFAEKFGDAQAHWMANCWRNLLLYPNVFMMDQMSSQIRMFRPLAVDKTLVTAVCFAPKNESSDKRSIRLRQYEDFFNASGMATPDDLAAFNASQIGFNASNAEWSDISRGARNQFQGADRRAEKSGFVPQYGGKQLQDEGIYLNQHHQWLELLTRGLKKEPYSMARAAE